MASFGSVPADRVRRRRFLGEAHSRMTDSTGKPSPPKVKVTVSPRWVMSRTPTSAAAVRSSATSISASTDLGGSP